MLRNRLGPKRGEVKHTGEYLVVSFVTLCSLPNGIQFIKPRREREREPGHEAYVGGQGRHIHCAGGKNRKKDQLAKLRLRKDDNFKIDLQGVA